MKNKLNIYLLSRYNERLVDFLLPVYTVEQFIELKETAGTCFKIQKPRNVEIVLACINHGNVELFRIDIESACKANSNISFSIVVDEKEQTTFLRAFTDTRHSGLYPLPTEFVEKSRL